MTSDGFDLWRRRGCASGQRRLADTVRTLLFRTDERLFERMDFADDAAFLHPTLFACLTGPAPASNLAQTLYGLTAPSRRPERIPVRTDARGRAFLGPLGILETDLAEAELEFGRDGPEAPYSCTRGGAAAPFRFRVPVVAPVVAPSAAPGAAMHVTTDIDPLFHRFFTRPDGVAIDMDRAQAPRARAADALLAIGLLRACCPKLWFEIAGCVRLVALFTSEAPNSFAALSAHGAIFCNLQPADGPLAVLEDLAHQGAHVIFNAFASDPARLLRVDGEERVASVADAPGDDRSLLAAFHALFTYTLILRALAAVRGSPCVTEVQSHELLGRIGFTLQKFAYDLRILDLPHLYTDAGRRCYAAFAGSCAGFQARHGRETAGLDLSGQPYVFDYHAFVARNGGPWPLLCACA